MFVAPGDGAFTLSHKGGEHEAFEDLAQQVVDMHGIRYADSRTWHNWIELQMDHWTLQMDRLVNAYLNYCYHDMGDGLPAPEESENSAQCLTDTELVNLFSKYHHAMLPYKPHHLYSNEVLIYHGYIRCSPVLPTVAVSLWTLATYHQIHRICPWFSIQAQCKLLCHLHDVCLHSFL
ncbi:hypothetical protein PISMIDRAFT_121064 [Pisolithus microcarpus 441]|uniref:Uncharacterized protein n=1 Tax=Pisolithus microcarpus 441 TaxID=765257 RepID=A0A0C9Y5P3_9AGAM|nr:hypothetical protein PISMIDRAFT_121064 [Pisolithus microcarpus 441]